MVHSDAQIHRQLPIASQKQGFAYTAFVESMRSQGTKESLRRYVPAVRGLSFSATLAAIAR
jgi:hypothetical protein